MLHNRSTPLKLEKKILLCAQRVDNDDVVAGEDARSHEWTICGGSDAIVLSYGPIVILLLLGFHSGS